MYDGKVQANLPTYIGPKVHVVATWGTIKELSISTPF